MQPRHPLQHRLRLLVSSHAAGNSPAGGTPNSSSSTATRRASLGTTPTASPLKGAGAPTAAQLLLGTNQPGNGSGSSSSRSGGGPFNPNWLLLVSE